MRGTEHSTYEAASRWNVTDVKTGVGSRPASKGGVASGEVGGAKEGAQTAMQSEKWEAHNYRHIWGPTLSPSVPYYVTYGVFHGGP